ncbi:MAG: DUF2868 domain-containing protein [Steroidobacteraceae bacterium]
MHDPAHESPPLFVDAIEIPAYLEADRALPYTERLHRDCTIGASLSTLDPLRRVRAWRRAQASPESLAGSARELAERLQRGRGVIGLVILLLGAITGAGVVSAVFHYDGTWPVNVVTVLAVLVLLQLALVLLSLLLMLPRLPGVGALQNLIGGINPVPLIAAAYRRMSRQDESQADLLVWSAARGPTAARFARWQTLVWSQLGAIAFNIAALATAAALIAFTDIAFGWSTTLELDSAVAARIADVIAIPWQSFWPAAVPSETLVESSRFFRLSSAPPLQIAAQTLTGWWPFLLAAMATYGLLPRCVLLLVASFRLRKATECLLLDHPLVKALLDRLQAAEVALGAADSEIPAQRSDALAHAAPVGLTPCAAAIVWSSAIGQQAAKDWSRRNLQKEVIFAIEAGGERALEDDATVVRTVAAGRPKIVLLFVRAWEAPLLDLQDFLEKLRAAVGSACSIVVVPVGPEGAVATEPQRTTWARWVGRIADPAMYLESGA